MWSICDNLFLGEESDALDQSVLEGAGVTHIVNCAREIPCPFASEYTYLHLRLSDPDDQFIDHIADSAEFISRAVSDGTVLVHCKGGVSRSPSVILAYFCFSGLTLKDAAIHLGSVVPTRPNDIFLYQLAEYFDVQLDATGVQQLYRLLAAQVA